MKTEIIQYVRDDKRNPIGVVLGTKSPDGHFSIGWSVANIKKGDKFDKKRGIDIARIRASVNTNNTIPNFVQPIINNIFKRLPKYFKETNFTIIAGNGSLQF